VKWRGLRAFARRPHDQKRERCAELADELASRGMSDAVLALALREAVAAGRLRLYVRIGERSAPFEASDASSIMLRS